MDKPKNHPPALSTDPGCEHCYRGRVLIDIALGTPVEPNTRTYGATWQLCTFCVATPSPTEDVQAQPTGLGICTDTVQSSGGGPTVRRKTLKERSERAARRDEIAVFAYPNERDVVLRIAAKLWREGYRLGRREATRVRRPRPLTPGQITAQIIKSVEHLR